MYSLQEKLINPDFYLFLSYLKQEVCPDNMEKLEDDQETVEYEIAREELKDPTYIIDCGVKYPERK